MSSTKVLSMRSKSVRNIQKITKSMKVVAAVKFSQSQRALIEARPMGESSRLFYEKIDVEVNNLNSKVPRILFAITSDRGLCGPIHTKVANAVERELAYISGESKVICVGNMSKIRIRSTVYKDKIALVAKNYGRLPPKFLDASAIAIETLKIDFDFGKIMYNKFKNVIVYAVSQIKLFSKDAALIAPRLQIYEELESNLDSYMEFSLATIIYYTLMENACCENASRMLSMDSASKSSAKLITNLSLQLNRKRQAAITNELMEIISGAEAVAPKDV